MGVTIMCMDMYHFIPKISRLAVDRRCYHCMPSCTLLSWQMQSFVSKSILYVKSTMKFYMKNPTHTVLRVNSDHSVKLVFLKSIDFITHNR